MSFFSWIEAVPAVPGWRFRAGRRYGLERGTDLVTWPLVRQVTAAPDGTIVFLDHQPREAKAYYRLRAY